MEPSDITLIESLRHRLHELAELPMQETRTKACLMDFLRCHTTLQIEDRGVWFYARHDAGHDRAHIAFRADFDAIAMDEGIDIPHASKTPGVSHKCGHDGHSAILAGLAMEANREGAAENLIFLFQPGEETGEGAEACMGIFEEYPIRTFFALHNMPGIPLGTVALKDGAMFCASTGLKLDFEGASSHASDPESGKNPASAMADTIKALPECFDPGKCRGLVMATLTHAEAGERTFGIAAGQGSLWVTCRGEHQDEMESAIDALTGYAQGRAREDGLKLRCSRHESFPETANHPEMSARVRFACKELGIPVSEMASPFRASEDFGHFLNRVPGAMFLVGGGDTSAVHTTDYDFPDGIIETSIKLLRRLGEIA